MKNYLKLVLPLLVVFLVSSCKKENNMGNTLTGSEFFPQSIGIEKIFQVDSIYWDEFTGINDTVNYEIKEIIADTFTDAQGKNAMRIERFRKNANGIWQLYKVWSSNKTTTTCEVTEDNIRYLKLVSPVTENETWNGNTYNANDDEIYTANDVNAAGSINTLTFANTITINQLEDINMIYERLKVEKYAENVGMYYRYNKSIDIEFISGNIKSGFIYTESLVSYIIPN